jgi:hypothetical protein
MGLREDKGSIYGTICVGNWGGPRNEIDFVFKKKEKKRGGTQYLSICDMLF